VTGAGSRGKLNSVEGGRPLEALIRVGRDDGLDLGWVGISSHPVAVTDRGFLILYRMCGWDCGPNLGWKGMGGIMDW